MEKPRSQQADIKFSSEKLPPPTPISQELIIASVDVANTIQKGKDVSDAQAKTLADATINEFTKGGPPLTPDQRTEFQKQAKKTLKGEPTGLKTDQDLPKLNLKEYSDTFQYVYSLYGLKKHATKMNFLEGIMLTKAMMTELTLPLLLQNTPKIFQSSQTGKLFEQIKDFGSMDWGAKTTFLKTAAKATFPIWGPVTGQLSSMLVDEIARKAYEKQTMFIRDAISDRIANSVFMRDFEFIQDKSPAEILNIIDKGKQGTMNLINSTYTEILPKFASIGSAAGSGFSINALGGLLGIIRLPILYATNKRILQQIIGERRQELKQKDAVDTRIMTSLQSIEVVKASDTMENAISELNKSIKQRDTLAIESRKRLVRRNQTGDYLDFVFGTAVPAGLGYMEYNKLKNKPPDLTKFATSMGVSSEDAKAMQSETGDLNELFNLSASGEGGFDAFAAMQAFGTFNSIALAQSRAGEKAGDIIRIYSDKIQPAIQDIKRMEELLGPYDLLDKPNGVREISRKPVQELPNFDIQIQNLNFKNILHDVSMDIPQGSFVTIKGPSGIGKTTFLRHLVGFYPAEAGGVQFGGTDLSKVKKFGDQSIYTKLAYANQNPQYFENMTLRENLLLWTKKRVPDEKLAQVLHDLNLDHIADRMDSKVKHFSGGELRRIGIARSLIKDPKVLFLDEPTANLDEESAKQVLDIVKSMRKTRPDMTVVAVTHDPNFEAIAEQIVDFREINRPTENDAAPLGNRQVFYAASAAVPSKI